MFKEELHHANEIQNVSDAINDIADSCDTQALTPLLFEILNVVLGELNKTITGPMTLRLTAI